MFHEVQCSDDIVVTPDDFAHVCIAHGLCDSEEVKVRLQTAFTYRDDARNVEVIFSELKSKWDARGAEMLTRIGTVDDRRVRERLLILVQRHHDVSTAAPSPYPTVPF